MYTRKIMLSAGVVSAVILAVFLGGVFLEQSIADVVYEPYPRSTDYIPVEYRTSNYAEVSRYLWRGQLPPVSAVRIDELVNNFSYNYPKPWLFEPLSLITRVAACPWDASHQLLLVGLRAGDSRPVVSSPYRSYYPMDRFLRDIRVQIEFNPDRVDSWASITDNVRGIVRQGPGLASRYIGTLRQGQEITALYEITPAYEPEIFYGPRVDRLRYQPRPLWRSPELMTVKVNWKDPGSGQFRELSKTVMAHEVAGRPEGDFGFAAAVAEFGLILANGGYRSGASYEDVLDLAGSASWRRSSGARQEFIALVHQAQAIDGRFWHRPVDPPVYGGDNDSYQPYPYPAGRPDIQFKN